MNREQISGVMRSFKIEVIRDKYRKIVLSTQFKNNNNTIKILKEVLRLMEMGASHKSSTN